MSLPLRRHSAPSLPALILVNVVIDIAMLLWAEISRVHTRLFVLQVTKAGQRPGTRLHQHYFFSYTLSTVVLGSSLAPLSLSTSKSPNSYIQSPNLKRSQKASCDICPSTRMYCTLVGRLGAMAWYTCTCTVVSQ